MTYKAYAEHLLSKWMNMLIYSYQQWRDIVGKHQWVNQLIKNKLVDKYPIYMNKCNHVVKYWSPDG